MRQQQLIEQPHSQQRTMALAVEQAQRLLLLIIQLRRTSNQEKQWSQQPYEAAEIIRRQIQGVYANILMPWSGIATHPSGDILNMRQQLLLRCAAALRQQVTEVADQALLQLKLLLQHKTFLQNKLLWVPRRGVEGFNQDLYNAPLKAVRRETLNSRLRTPLIEI
ncbi:hypothetical protein cyc_06548 [Cyclospora cayetanensis]|nr:hypothetical protein cyc_06548 [Cyclospora cayetanensis]